ncbi:MAG: hypothetical protein J6S85_19435 [Methanobrevibacter sp.]|nr:hypothetical protein [Methanobrevibacter sp.]
MINFIGMSKALVERELETMGFQLKGVIFENPRNICLEYRTSTIVRTLEITFQRKSDGLFCSLLRLY